MARPDVDGEAAHRVAQLTPLAYQREIATRLQALEPRGWGLFASAVSDGLHAASPVGPVRDPIGGAFAEAASELAEPQADPGTAASESDPGAAARPITEPEVVRRADDDLEQQLLRHAYRMEAGAHPRVHAAAARAAAALELTVPIAIYQLEGESGANASLAFRPHEAVVAISGNLLALLSDDELAACFGHELAHHRLWTTDGGQILVAARFLDALSMDAGSPAWYLETARRFDLATELFADRGSLEACGSLDAAIASLVKVATGLAEVDPVAYLRQARDARPSRGADGSSHPETVLRAWALEQWQAGDGDAAASTLLSPALDIDRLDLVDRERLEALTRRLVMEATAGDWMRTDDVSSHARQFLVDVTPSVETATGRFSRSTARAARASDDSAAPVTVRIPDDASAETRRFLSYVLLDLATVDPGLDDESLVEMLAVAREAGIGPTFEEVARKELAMSARAWDALNRRSAERRLPAETSPHEPAPPADAGATASEPTLDNGSAPIELAPFELAELEPAQPPEPAPAPPTESDR